MAYHARCRSSVTENPKGLAFPVWDGEADVRRADTTPHYTTVEEAIIEKLRDEGPQSQWHLCRYLTAAGLDDRDQRKLSSGLLRLRQEGVVVSNTDKLVRRTPKSKPFFSPLWELA